MRVLNALLKPNSVRDTLIGITAKRISNLGRVGRCSVSHRREAQTRSSGTHQRMILRAHLKRRISEACSSWSFWRAGADDQRRYLPSVREAGDRAHGGEDVGPEVVALAKADLQVDRGRLEALVLHELERVVVDVGTALDALEGGRKGQRSEAASRCDGRTSTARTWFIHGAPCFFSSIGMAKAWPPQ